MSAVTALPRPAHDRTRLWPSFELEPERAATSPPETRGLEPDEVRLLVAARDGTTHARLRDLPSRLDASDLLLVNVSATIPAAVDGHTADATPVTVHVAGPDPAAAGQWLVELRRSDGRGPVTAARVGEVVALPDGGRLELCGPYPVQQLLEPGLTAAFDGRRDRPSRLWTATAHLDEPLASYLERLGRPVTYAHAPERWPLRAYQTVFGRVPGSAEMASASRPFTERLVVDLVAAGVAIAPVLLHAGLSSPERGEPPMPERFEVSAATARRVEQTRRDGGRVIAVGTTAVRAIESVVSADGQVGPAAGWTDLVLGPGRPARLVDGLVTGWHEPEASHLDLLEAVAGRELVRAAYEAALLDGYRWHEFGDSCLLLP